MNFLCRFIVSIISYSLVFFFHFILCMPGEVLKPLPPYLRTISQSSAMSSPPGYFFQLPLYISLVKPYPTFVALLWDSPQSIWSQKLYPNLFLLSINQNWRGNLISLEKDMGKFPAEEKHTVHTPTPTFS